MFKIQIIPKRVKPEERDPSLFYYGIRHSDNDWGKPISVEPSVVVNFWGTLVSTISLDEVFKKDNGGYNIRTPKLRAVLYDNSDTGEFIDGCLLFPSLK